MSYKTLQVTGRNVDAATVLQTMEHCGLQALRVVGSPDGGERALTAVVRSTGDMAGALVELMRRLPERTRVDVSANLFIL